jgi:hypothetical protein
VSANPISRQALRLFGQVVTGLMAAPPERSGSEELMELRYDSKFQSV